MLPVTDQLPYVDDVPRFWFSRRWRLAFLGFVGFLIVTCQRTTIEVAIISMLNQTTPSAALGSISALNAAGYSRGYWSTRLGSTATPIAGEAPPLEANAPPKEEEFALPYYGGANGTLRLETDEAGRGSTTRRSSAGHEEIVMKNRFEMNNRRVETDGCSNASELTILNTTLFDLHARGDISWALTEQCGVLDAFYWGDLFIRVPSGFLSQRYGGKRVFGFAILLSSICTAVIPITSRVHYFAVILLRFITGASVGATIPAMSYLLGRWCPPDERCLLQSIANTGSGVSGAVVSIPLVGLLCVYGFDGGWPSAFYISGGLGMLWSIIWMLLANDSPNDDSRITVQEKDYINSSIFTRSGSTASILIVPSPEPAIYRWEVALTSLPVLALAVNHFTHEWVVYALMKIIPIYLTDVIHLDFKQNSVGTLVLPSVGFWCMMTMSAGAADRLQAYGVLGVTKIRKLMQTVGAILTAAMISSILLMNCHHHLATLSLLTLGMSFCGLQYSGALVAHLDVAPGCAGVTMGVVSALGASVYFILPPLIQMVLHVPTQSAELKWSIVLLLTASCHIFSSLLFLIFGSSNLHSWSVAGHPSVIDDVPAADDDDAAKVIAENSAIFDPSHPEFCSSVSNYGYISSASSHPHHRQAQYQQQQQEDVYHEALDPDDADLMETDSSNRSVTGGVHRQTSDDSCSHSCVSAASEISEGFHSSANQPSNSSSGTAATPAAEAADDGGRRSTRLAMASSSSSAAAAAAVGNDLSESIV